jgi:hypothetical protein
VEDDSKRKITRYREEEAKEEVKVVVIEVGESGTEWMTGSGVLVLHSRLLSHHSPQSSIYSFLLIVFCTSHFIIHSYITFSFRPTQKIKFHFICYHYSFILFHFILFHVFEFSFLLLWAGAEKNTVLRNDGVR